MSGFHITIQGRPEAGVEASAEGELTVSAKARSHPLSISFDQAYANMDSLPMLFIEPDGAFAWTRRGDNNVELWRVDGGLYDGGPALHYVEMKGHCTGQVWDELMLALAATPSNAMVQLVRRGVFISTERFRREYCDTKQEG